MNNLGPKETKALREKPRGGNTEMGEGERMPGPQAKSSEAADYLPSSGCLQRSGHKESLVFTHPKGLKFLAPVSSKSRKLNWRMFSPHNSFQHTNINFLRLSLTT